MYYRSFIPYLSNDRHEIGLIDVLLKIVECAILFDMWVDDKQRHQAFAVFLRQDALLLSPAGIQINFKSERVYEGADGSFLVETIRHVLEGKSVVSCVKHTRTTIFVGRAGGRLGGFGRLGRFSGLGRLGLGRLAGICTRHHCGKDERDGDDGKKRANGHD